jgi:hypothetical protein
MDMCCSGYTRIINTIFGIKSYYLLGLDMWGTPPIPPQSGIIVGLDFVEIVIGSGSQ